MVIDLAKHHGWLVAHFRPAQMRSGRWATLMMGDPGFPDLVLARRGRVIFAELKKEDGAVKPSQRRWLEELGEYGGLGDTLVGVYDVFVWRPSDRPTIEKVLA